MSSVDEEINSGEAGSQVTRIQFYFVNHFSVNLPSPPPSVIFSSEVKVAKKNSCFRTSDDEDDCYQKQESKHVVDLHILVSACLCFKHT